jgi:hypothetical protein
MNMDEQPGACLHLLQIPSHAYVVMNPVFWINGWGSGRTKLKALAAVTDRHIQYHSAIGFDRHIVYVRSQVSE